MRLLFHRIMRSGPFVVPSQCQQQRRETERRRDADVRLPLQMGKNTALLGIPAWMSDINLPVAPLRAQILSAVDVVVQQNRLRDGSRRIVGVYEAEGLGSQGEYVMRPLYEFKDRGEEPGTGRIIGELVSTGQRPTFAADMEARGVFRFSS